MRISALFFIVVLLSACSPETPQRVAPQSINSPSGAYSAKTEISGEEAGPTRRLCVRLKISDIERKRVLSFQTGASDVSTWAIGWTPTNVLVLYSSDIGIYAYEILDGAISERLADASEQEIGRTAYKKRYGEKPHT